jgi:hypothetical protein
VYAQYRLRPRSQVGLGPYSRPFLVPLAGLALARVAPELSRDAREVLYERSRFHALGLPGATAAGAGARAAGPVALDTASFGGAANTLKLRAAAAAATISASASAAARADWASSSDADGGSKTDGGGRSNLALLLEPVSEVQLAIAHAERDGLPREVRSDGGVAGRLGRVSEWMSRVRGEAAATALRPPAVAAAAGTKLLSSAYAVAGSVEVIAPSAAPLFPSVPTLAGDSGAPALRALDASLKSSKAWRLLDELCAQPPAAAAAFAKTGSRLQLAPIPLMRKWGEAEPKALLNPSSYHEHEHEHEPEPQPEPEADSEAAGDISVEQLMQELRELEMLRDIYESERASVSDVGGARQEGAGGREAIAGTLAVQDGLELKTQSKADEWLKRLVKASPLL